MLFRKLLLLSVVILLLNSCKLHVVTFEKPQPAGTSDLESFPQKLCGEYLNTDDSSKLSVTENGFFISETQTDSNGVSKTSIDTFFLISNKNVLRKFKGYYFLNIQGEQKDWIVEMVRFTHGQLLFSSISSDEDLNRLKEITQQPEDTLPYNPTKKQMKKLIRDDGFTTNQTYVKMK